MPDQVAQLVYHFPGVISLPEQHIACSLEQWIPTTLELTAEQARQVVLFDPSLLGRSQTGLRDLQEHWALLEQLCSQDAGWQAKWGTYPLETKLRMAAAGGDSLDRLAFMLQAGMAGSMAPHVVIKAQANAFDAKQPHYAAWRALRTAAQQHPALHAELEALTSEALLRACTLVEQYPERLQRALQGMGAATAGGASSGPAFSLMEVLERG